MVNAPIISEAPAASRQVLSYALRVRGIRVQSHMGVSDVERATKQELVVAVDLDLRGEHYPVVDELSRAADYAEVVRIVDDAANQRPDRLLETYALRVARRLGERWPTAQRVRVAVTKARVPVSPTPDEATVEVTLGPAAS